MARVDLEDVADEVAGRMNDLVNREYRRLRRKGLTDKQAYDVVQLAVEFILTHLEEGA